MLCPTLCDPMNYSTADFPFLRYFLEFAQTHVHWVSDTIHPSHPLLPPTFSLSQHQGLFQLVGSLHQVAKVWSFRFSISRSSEYLGLISFKIDWFDLLAVPRDSQESSPAPQFESINFLALSPLCGPSLTSIHDYWKNHSFDCVDFLRIKWDKIWKAVSRYQTLDIWTSDCCCCFFHSLALTTGLWCGPFAVVPSRELSLWLPGKVIILCFLNLPLTH